MSSVREREAPAAGVSRSVTLVDADVHPVITQTEIKKRLPARWRQHLETFGRPHDAQPERALSQGGARRHARRRVAGRRRRLPRQRSEAGPETAPRRVRGRLRGAQLRGPDDLPRGAGARALPRTRAQRFALGGMARSRPALRGSRRRAGREPGCCGQRDRALRGRRTVGAGDHARRAPKSRSEARNTGRSSVPQPSTGSRSRFTSAVTTRIAGPAGRPTTSRSTSATRSRWRASC